MFSGLKGIRSYLLAVALLAALAGQCFFLASRTNLTSFEESWVQSGNDFLSSALQGNPRSEWAFVGAMAASHSPFVNVAPDSTLGRVLVRLPFIGFGLLLGGAVWYVARRLYGRLGGYIALSLYCFSPVVVEYSSTAQPHMVAAFGVFGTVFTGIAVAHTLYAPREVILWNWRRILLLGAAIALAVAALPAAVWALVLTLAFMFYLAPERRGAAVVIVLTAATVAIFALLAMYQFHLRTFAESIATARWGDLSAEAIGSPTVYAMLGLFLLRNSTSFVFLLAVALVTFVAWKRSRYFGTIAPLAAAAVLALLALVMPQAAGFEFLVVAVPFAFLFAGGVWADLLEAKDARLRTAAIAVAIAGLLTHAMFSISGLIQVGLAHPAAR